MTFATTVSSAVTRPVAANMCGVYRVNDVVRIYPNRFQKHGALAEAVFPRDALVLVDRCTNTATRGLRFNISHDKAGTHIITHHELRNLVETKVLSRVTG